VPLSPSSTTGTGVRAVMLYGWEGTNAGVMTITCQLTAKQLGSALATIHIENGTSLSYTMPQASLLLWATCLINFVGIGHTPRICNFINSLISWVHSTTLYHSKIQLRLIWPTCSTLSYFNLFYFD